MVFLEGFREDVDALLAAGDLFVFPSHIEGMPNVVLKAYAAGLPVVASDAGGLAEAVCYEHTGLLVQPGDDGALAEAILRVLRDDPFRRRLAEQGRAWARPRFSVERVAARYESLYQALCDVRRPMRQPALTSEYCA